jgi:ribosomal protein S18 acetylase RimI-like enzyme
MVSDKILIQKAKPEDIHLISMTKEQYDGFTPFKIDQSVQPNETFIAKHQEKVIGFVQVVRTGAHEGELAAIAVHKEYRGAGLRVGTALMEKAKNYFIAKKMSFVGLLTHNPRAKAFFRKTFTELKKPKGTTAFIRSNSANYNFSWNPKEYKRSRPKLPQEKKLTLKGRKIR